MKQAGYRLWLGPVVAVVVLAAVGVVAYRTTAAFVAQGEVRRGLVDRLRQLDAFLLTVRRAESGQRGYLLTGQDDYLLPYREAVDGVPPSGDPVADRLAAEKLDEMARTIRLHGAGDRAAALALVRSDRGRRLMRQIEAAVAGRRDAIAAEVARGDAARESAAAVTLFVLPAGGMLGVVVAGASFAFGVRELARRRAAEQRAVAALEDLRRVEQELRRSNADLEQFAYAAGHDLQQPLRAIGGFVGLLAQEYRGRLDERADGWIDRTVRAVKRMQAMIDDILELSRLSTRPVEPGAVDLVAAALEARDNLKEQIDEAGGYVRIPEMLSAVYASRRHCVQVFQNLISNAIKYRDPARPPRIVILPAPPRDDLVVIAVADNGAGIEPEHHVRIWDVFARLDTSKPGTGVGLAIVKRAVERNGGRVWVESTPGVGSTFYVALPPARGPLP